MKIFIRVVPDFSSTSIVSVEEESKRGSKVCKTVL